jgi:hypothetical protein
MTTLCSLVVAPKEKRLGQRILKEVIIRSHSDPLLCPVTTVRSYLSRHTYRPSQHPHLPLSHVTINYFTRDIRDCHRPGLRSTNSKSHQVHYGYITKF